MNVIDEKRKVPGDDLNLTSKKKKKQRNTLTCKRRGERSEKRSNLEKGQMGEKGRNSLHPRGGFIEGEGHKKKSKPTNDRLWRLQFARTPTS